MCVKCTMCIKVYCDVICDKLTMCLCCDNMFFAKPKQSLEQLKKYLFLVPGQPRFLMVTLSVATGFIISWVEPVNNSIIDEYVVRWKVGDDLEWSQTSTNETELILTDLIPATRYEIEIYAINMVGNGTTVNVTAITGVLTLLLIICT